MTLCIHECMVPVGYPAGIGGLNVVGVVFQHFVGPSRIFVEWGGER